MLRARDHPGDTGRARELLDRTHAVAHELGFAAVERRAGILLATE
jgi:hypothetical protein